MHTTEYGFGMYYYVVLMILCYSPVCLLYVKDGASELFIRGLRTILEVIIKYFIVLRIQNSSKLY